METFIKGREGRLASLFISLLVTSLIIVSSILVGTRSDVVGADTYAYKYYFRNLAHTLSEDKFEPLFYILAKFFNIFSNVEVFFFAINFIFLLCILFYMSNFKRGNGLVVLFFISISFMLVSNWYLTAVTNGLRQGIAIPFIFLSFIYAYKRNFILYLACGLVACGFHYSSFIFIPFAFLLLLKSKKVFFFLYIAISVGYLLGFNEQLIKLTSDGLKLPIYAMIKNYAGGVGPWNGFNIIFYLYSNFWFVISIIFLYLFPSKIDRKFNILVFTYGTLLMPYFIFGFGPFSNRYAFPAWLYLPILHAGFFYFLKVSAPWKLSLALCVASLSLIKFGFLFS
ncbi:EpsG family protein [Shewanella xiamenensis]|uniref:EpsG family protein n=1 Tax=Shewanella xiamenensis TaxID=332186 RepID=UPI00313D37B6